MFKIRPQKHFEPVHIHTLANHFATWIHLHKLFLKMQHHFKPRKTSFINRVITACPSVKLETMYSDNNQARNRYSCRQVIHKGERKPQAPNYSSPRLLPSNGCFRVCALTLACNLFVCVFISQIGSGFAVQAGLGPRPALNFPSSCLRLLGGIVYHLDLT